MNEVKTYGFEEALPKLMQYLARDKRSIKDRYEKFLSKNLQPFTEEENKQILKLYNQHPGNWRLISKQFSHRSDIQIRIQYYKLKSKKYAKKHLELLKQISENSSSDENNSDINKEEDLSYLIFEDEKLKSIFEDDNNVTRSIDVDALVSIFD